MSHRHTEMLTSVSLCDMMEDLLGLSITVSRRLSVNLEVLYVDFSHPVPAAHH